MSMLEAFHGAGQGGHDAVVALYATRGLIVDEIYRTSGIPGLLRFAKERGSTEDIIRILPGYVTGTGLNIDEWWRAKTAQALNRYGTR
jgi:hypothetical protein